MKKSDKRAIFKTTWLALALFTLSACTKQEMAKTELDSPLLVQQVTRSASTAWYIQGCPWYGCALDDGQ